MNQFLGQFIGLHTAISRKVVGKMYTEQSRKVIWDMINTLFLTTVAVEPTFVAFLQHSQTHFHGLSCQFFQMSLKNRELKTTELSVFFVIIFVIMCLVTRAIKVL